MSDAERPQITLITPPAFDLEVFPDRLAAVLDSTEIAYLRLSLASRKLRQFALEIGGELLRRVAIDRLAHHHVRRRIGR